MAHHQLDMQVGQDLLGGGKPAGGGFAKAEPGHSRVEVEGHRQALPQPAGVPVIGLKLVVIVEDWRELVLAEGVEVRSDLSMNKAVQNEDPSPRHKGAKCCPLAEPGDEEIPTTASRQRWRYPLHAETVGVGLDDGRHADTARQPLQPLIIGGDGSKVDGEPARTLPG
jgi:hypothetical protein